jgi:hypothetical protein
MFLFRIMVGAVAPLNRSALWPGCPHTTNPTPDAQQPTSRSPTEPTTPDSNTNNEPTPPYVTAELTADPSPHRDIRRLLRRRERFRSGIDFIQARPT